MEEVNFVKLSRFAKEPTQHSDDSVGYDIYNPINQDILIQPNQQVEINTKISIEIPNNVWILIASKSGIAKTFQTYVQGGIIDQGYRGPIIVLLKNTGSEKVLIRAGEPIAQLIFLPVLKKKFKEVSTIDKNTERGTRGFGGTLPNDA
ncbi:deoxyuridine 5'-triphosphate nucleotidohydrolase [Trichonephila clavata]|uniref:Deoxyuridine 5'-triphosphate nucleotidohydrolase n=1 Tax=Trichonephila clavata TaxID=2740835 RepID=A0A8X6G6G6_TRICU|nr:deoxyuridine 5'-triphosphate nucleotidohydrolase [Trichonephila clavata]